MLSSPLDVPTATDNNEGITEVPVENDSKQEKPYVSAFEIGDDEAEEESTAYDRAPSDFGNEAGNNKNDDNDDNSNDNSNATIGEKLEDMIVSYKYHVYSFMNRMSAFTDSVAEEVQTEAKDINEDIPAEQERQRSVLEEVREKQKQSFRKLDILEKQMRDMKLKSKPAVTLTDDLKLQQEEEKSVNEQNTKQQENLQIPDDDLL